MHRNLYSAIIFVAGTILLTMLSGCATTGRVSCTSSDWQRFGEEDGSNGRPASWVDKRSKTCAGQGGLPDITSYEAGRSRGLQSYCTATSGYRAGVHIKTYENVCPANLEPAFLGAMEIGLRIGAIRVRQIEISNALLDIRTELAKPRISSQDQLTMLRQRDQLLQEQQQLEAQLGIIRLEAKAYIENSKRD